MKPGSGIPPTVIGNATFAKTVTTVAYMPDSVTVQGVVEVTGLSDSGVVFTGVFRMTLKMLSSTSVEYTEAITVSDNEESVSWEYDGVLTR